MVSNSRNIASCRIVIAKEFPWRQWNCCSHSSWIHSAKWCRSAVGWLVKTSSIRLQSIAPQSGKKEKDTTASFSPDMPALTATASMYTFSICDDASPTISAIPWIWTGAVLIPLTTGYLRYKAGKHFPSDILAGFIIRSINGILIPQLQKNNFCRFIF